MFSIVTSIDLVVPSAMNGVPAKIYEIVIYLNSSFRFNVLVLIIPILTVILRSVSKVV